MVRILIVADDLTGALDSTAAFADRGLKVLVIRDACKLESAWAQGPDVLALATGTRELAEDEALARIQSLAAPLVGWPEIVFKKVDSRLKGHVAAEVDAVSRLFGLSSAVVAPAIPDFGRIHRNGWLEGAGIDEPIDILALFAGLPVPVQVPDVSAAGDFAAIVAKDKGDILLVGARGLASALAQTLVASHQPASQALLPPLLYTIGSRDPITLAQVALLRQGEDIEIVEAPNGIFAPTRTNARATLVQMTPGASEIDSQTAAAHFAAGLAGLTEILCPATIIASGGETGNSLLAELGVSVLHVERELLPGIALSRFTHGECSVALVTKSGGFGSPDTLLQLQSLLD